MTRSRRRHRRHVQHRHPHPIGHLHGEDTTGWQQRWGGHHIERRAVQGRDLTVPPIVGDRPPERVSRTARSVPRHPGREERVAHPAVALERLRHPGELDERSRRRRRPAEHDRVAPPVVELVDRHERGARPDDLRGVGDPARRRDDRDRGGRVGLPRRTVPVLRRRQQLAAWDPTDRDPCRARVVGRDSQEQVEPELAVTLGVQIGPVEIGRHRPPVQRRRRVRRR